MAWSTITGAGVSIATKFFGDVMNKINNMFNGVDISDTVTINANVTWQFNGSAFRIRDSDDTNNYIFVGGNLTADRNVNLPVLGANDTIDFIGTASTHTGAKTFNDTKLFLRNVADTFSVSFVNTITADRIYTLPDAAGTVVITGLADQIANTEITAHTSTKITITAKGQLNSSIAYTDAAVTWGDFLSTFKDNQFKINSPDDADGVTFVNSNQTADRNLTIPVLVGADTIATLGVAQTFSGAKTFSSVLTMSGAGVNLAGNDLDNIQNLIHDLSTSGTDIDFTEDELQEISISADTTFTGVNYAIGKSKVVKITTDSTLRTLAFPTGWVFVGSKPADQAASKEGILSLTSFTAVESGVIASYAVEE